MATQHPQQRISAITMACAAAAAHGGRCRHLALAGSPFCSQHQGSESRAPSPNVIQVKMTLHPFQYRHFQKLGVLTEVREEEKLRAKHAAEAERIGRHPSAIRPDSADSGCPVFGRDGLSKVSFAQFFADLSKNEYYPVAVGLYQRSKDVDAGGGVLALTYEYFSEESTLASSLAYFVQVVTKYCLAQPWRYTHIWENPPKEDDKGIRYVATVNLAAPLKPWATPNGELRMTRWQWQWTATQPPPGS